jgi:Na+-transporting methylmalonyl-CoA/oxaloacetate decarboxylase gamma subunit
MTAFQQGLLISAMGMGLVFIMIVVLWGIMAGMVAIFKQKEKPEVVEVVSEAVAGADADSEFDAQNSQVELAAAVAVSFALALRTLAPNQSVTQSTRWNPSTRAYQPFRQHKGW